MYLMAVFTVENAFPSLASFESIREEMLGRSYEVPVDRKWTRVVANAHSNNISAKTIKK